MLVSGCAWRALPPCLGASKSTVYRRFAIWSRADVMGAAASEDAPAPGRAGLGRPVSCGPRFRPREGEIGGELAGPSPRGLG
ncbi:hypothetical protein BM536_000100 [Streptomyces phaeoluteigriseus]|uniref:Insertion element IS402-like domain-containing protein n=1 Tax=Streptomyces phaeoluteigriseus TaxID=114686 RepID=A0A1V6MZS1_9ACTN|nr:hypothetical protein BM536_000100 [Streptomyces phaeoluteigriseus]